MSTGLLVGIIVGCIVVVAILGGLWHLNKALDLEKSLHSPWPELHELWLPLLFLLVYLLSWLGYRLWGLELTPTLTPDGRQEEPPVADREWRLV